MRYICTVFLLFSAVASATNGQLKIIQLTDNVYQHISYQNIKPWGLVGASGLVVIDGNNAHIIDTPWTSNDAEALIKWITAKKLTLKSTVVTHFHEDASGGIELLNHLNIRTYATPKTNHLLKRQGREQSSHDITRNTFELVTGTIEIFYPGAGHTEDNVVVWLPQSNTLFAGCFVKSKQSKSLGNIEDASVEDWPLSIQKVINKYPGIETVVPGHGKVGDISLLKHTEQLALGVSASNEKLIKK